MADNQVEAKLAGRGFFTNNNELRVFKTEDEYLYVVLDPYGVTLDRGYTEIRDEDVYSPLDYVLLWCDPLEVKGSYTTKKEVA